MRKGIVVTTSKYTEKWLDECLDSLPKNYPILVVSNNFETPKANVVNNWNGFEVGGIKRGAEVFDEFIHLMDTCVINNPEIIERSFEHQGSVYFTPGFFSYLGKYKKDILDKIGVPIIHTKAEAVECEARWNGRYLAQDKDAIQFRPILPVESDVFEEKNGRLNMVLSNGFITKYKGTWRPDQIK